MSNNIEEFVKENTSRISNDIKKSIYDWICAIIIIAVIAASLDIIGIIDLSGENAWEQIANFLMQWIPYFMANILLSNTLYKKGIFVGKGTTNFINTSKTYGVIVNSLTGKQITDLQQFCDKYNEDALKTIQTNILKKEGLTYDSFEVEYKITKDNLTTSKPPLKTWIKEDLEKEGFNKLQIKAIKNAKKVSIKGLNVNVLLCSMNIKDPTNLGKNEKELTKKHNITNVLGYLISTGIMSLLAIKNISDWGWSGLILVLFKVIYTFARSYMSYFQGYNDITIDLANHIARKIDILKMYTNDSNILKEESIVQNLQ